MIVFVGDKPSKKNIDPEVPFVGTRSYKTLLAWIYKMDIDISKVATVNATDHPTANDWVIMANEENWKVVCLGTNALKAVMQARREWDCSVDIFHLPHPSGSNRKLNDRTWLEGELQKCRNWLTS